MINKLEMFIALAREGHFRKAADSMNISQPTLSAGIKQLEEQLGVQLVYRGSRFGGLTPEGQTTLGWAQKIVGDARQLREEMRVKRHGLSGELRLAVIPTALTWAARLAAVFMEKHPRVRFTILSRTSREILEMLENLETDAGISYLDNEPLGRVETVQLYDERMVLICDAGNPLAARPDISWQELKDQPLALLTPDMQNRRIINRLSEESGVTPRASIESNSIVALTASVSSGRCMTVLPEDIARFLATGRDLVLVPLRETGRALPVGLVLPHRDPRTPVLEALYQEAQRLDRET
ncbi:LysR family transcriptional regulator [Paracoccus sp. SCSIO 75233]|uniref:LysR family transcriptional regulator n=1 Tax=Paracoccus sp. SCSIO 75233 TaxID=3017782 RepID=UPI0022F094DE|nr:LysR family transcriptional regulator [Paracoccus sp. SCSIO 75233]WBU54460.1 LysR family transcriptional regulator [Paracoccus sp. SCSIO 75233]